MSLFNEVKVGPPIEVFALNKGFAEDSCLQKCNLGVGAYRTEEGKPWVLPVVREAEIKIASDLTPNHEYLPVLGLESFTSAALNLLLGEDNLAIKEKRAFGVQTLSGTGALRLGAEFLAKILERKTFYYSKPTWVNDDRSSLLYENHRQIFLNAGFTNPKEYRYWNPTKKNVDIEGMLEDLRTAPEDAVVILHCCAHNPTGCDPTKEQWEKILEVVKERKLFPFFDSAYQGFASGDPEADSWPVRFALHKGFEFFCAQSFAKNFGLYNERAGNLTVVAQTESVLIAMKSQITLLVRAMYSNPPNHGAQIVSLVLNDKVLRQQWLSCIQIMSSRIILMRKELRKNLERLETPGTWDHITQQIGMFSYTGLNEKQVEHLIQKHHIYLLKSGRINMCGVNPSNVAYIASAIDDTVRSISGVSSPL